ncbi:MAG: flagellar biosynthetic protein FliR [Planctomycetota bacterium]
MVNLGPVLDHLPAWLMVLVRLTGIFLLAPMFGSSAIPRTVKVMLVVGMSLCVYPMLIGQRSAAVTGLPGIVEGGLPSIWVLGAMVALELLMGYVIGYAASLPLIGMQVGGQVIDQQMGIAAGGVFNPDLDSEAGVIGQFFFLTGLTVFLLIGGHQVLLLTLVGSFEAVPVGQFATPGSVVDAEAMVALVVGLLTVIFELALRVAMPLLCILFLLRVVMGFVGRTVPQMNILSVGFIFYILAGMVVLILGAGTTLIVFRGTMTQTLQEIMSVFTIGTGR